MINVHEMCTCVTLTHNLWCEQQANGISPEKLYANFSPNVVHMTERTRSQCVIFGRRQQLFAQFMVGIYVLPQFFRSAVTATIHKPFVFVLREHWREKKPPTDA